MRVSTIILPRLIGLPHFRCSFINLTIHSVEFFSFISSFDSETPTRNPIHISLTLSLQSHRTTVTLGSIHGHACHHKRIFLSLAPVELFSLLPDQVSGQAATVNTFALQYNFDPFNLTADTTAPCTAPDPVPEALAPPLNGTPHDSLAPNTMGLKGVHPYSDRLRRTLCYCCNPEPGTWNSGPVVTIWSTTMLSLTVAGR